MSDDQVDRGIAHAQSGWAGDDANRRPVHTTPKVSSGLRFPWSTKSLAARTNSSRATVGRSVASLTIGAWLKTSCSTTRPVACFARVGDSNAPRIDRSWPVCSRRTRGSGTEGRSPRRVSSAERSGCRADGHHRRRRRGQGRWTRDATYAAAVFDGFLPMLLNRPNTAMPAANRAIPTIGR